MQKRFCVVTSNQYPESFGGEETFIKQFTGYLGKQGIESVTLSSAGGEHPEVVTPRLPLFSLPLIGYEVFNFVWAFGATLEILRLHSIKRLGIIYSIDTGYAGLAAIWAGRLLRLPVIAHSHGERSENKKRIIHEISPWRAWPYWALERTLDQWVARHSTGLVAVSDEVSTFLQTLGADGSRIIIVSSAVDVANFDQRGRELPLWRTDMPADSIVFGYLGRLERLKGVEILLKAFGELIKSTNGAVFLAIGGDGPERERIEWEVENNNLRNVRLLGYQKDPAMFLRGIDVFVLPSFHEGSPMALLEAMASGLPIIASNISAVVNIIDGSAVLVPPGDSIALCVEMDRLRNDSKLRMRLASASLYAIREFSTEHILPKILGFCLKFVNNN